MKLCVNQIKRFVVFTIIFVSGISEARGGDFIETTGTVLSVTLPLVAGGMTLEKNDDPGRLQLAKAIAFTVAASYGLKYSIDATRPNGGKHSFPSAHTSVSFAAADFINRRYGWDYGIPAYIASGFVGYSRVEAKAHHRYDVLAGATIGILGNALFTSRFEAGGMNVSFVPVDDGGTLRLAHAW
ncbi:MAG: phosphatase PAP2 family protein [Chlorobiaceae bacterium]|nr:phosphatase PAP2 family protein [Chlorobiaceae bacterium]